MQDKLFQKYDVIVSFNKWFIHKSWLLGHPLLYIITAWMTGVGHQHYRIFNRQSNSFHGIFHNNISHVFLLSPDWILVHETDCNWHAYDIKYICTNTCLHYNKTLCQQKDILKCAPNWPTKLELLNPLLANGPLLGTRYTLLSANRPLLGHLFGYKFWVKLTAMSRIVFPYFKKNHLSTRFRCCCSFLCIVLCYRGKDWRVLSVKKSWRC